MTTTETQQNAPKERHAGVNGIRVFVQKPCAKPRSKVKVEYTNIYLNESQLGEMTALGATRKTITATCKLVAARCEPKPGESWSETVRKSALRALRHAKAYRDELEAEAAAENNKAWEQS